MQQLLIWPCEACQEMFKLHGTNEYVRANGRCQCLFVEEFQPTPKSSLQSDLFGYLVIPFGSNGRTRAIDPEELGSVNIASIRRIFRRNM